MFRFTIRDALWLMVVLAFAICWYLERDGRIHETERIRGAFRENELLKAQLREAEAAMFRVQAATRPALHLPMIDEAVSPRPPDPPSDVTKERAIEIVRALALRPGEQAEFKCAEVAEGYRVSVEFFTLDKSGDRHYFPGGHAVYVLDKTGRVISTTGGA
jgi:hypothetical protein